MTRAERPPRACWLVVLRAAAVALAFVALVAPAVASAEIDPLEDVLARTFSIDVQDGSLEHVFRLLAEDTGLNVISDPSVDRRITLRLRGVTWSRFLDLAPGLYDLRVERQGNVLLVLPRGHHVWAAATERDPGPLETRMVQLNYARARDIAPILQNVALSADGTISVDERTDTLIIRDHPANVAVALELVGKR